MYVFPHLDMQADDYIALHIRLRKLVVFLEVRFSESSLFWFSGPCVACHLPMAAGAGVLCWIAEDDLMS